MNDLTLRAIQAAQTLASSDGENAEYDRALVEMTLELIGLNYNEDRATIHRLITGREYE